MTASILATIPTNTSAAAVSEAQSTGTHALKTGKPITGKYLFNEFVLSKSDITKMNVVEAAVKSVPLTTFNEALKEMISLAKDAGDAVEKTARNHASVLRNVYGALTFKRKDMEAKGWTAGKTGYHTANTLAKAVLKESGIKWDGTRASTAEERAQKAQRRAEDAAFKAAMDVAVRHDGESFTDFHARVTADAALLVEAKLAEQAEARIKRLCEAVKKMCGNDLNAVLDTLLSEDATATQGE